MSLPEEEPMYVYIPGATFRVAFSEVEIEYATSRVKGVLQRHLAGPITLTRANTYEFGGDLKALPWSR